MTRFDQALARVRDFVIEPPASPAPAQPLPAADRHGAASLGAASVAVVGLAPGSGATTVSLGLTLLFSSVEPVPPCLLCLDQLEAEIRARPGVHAVPAALSQPEEVVAYGATVARLAARGSQTAAPMVWDVGARDAARGSGAMEAASVVVAVAGPAAEPALAGAVCTLLAERCPRVLLVANRVADRDPWSPWAAVCLPDSRLAAAMLGRGRGPGGAMGTALRGLAGLVQGVAAGTLLPGHGLFGRRAAK